MTHTRDEIDDVVGACRQAKGWVVLSRKERLLCTAEVDGEICLVDSQLFGCSLLRAEKKFSKLGTWPVGTNEKVTTNMRAIGKVSHDAVLVRALETGQRFAVLAWCVSQAWRCSHNGNQGYLDIDASGEMSAHLPPGVTNRLRDWDILDEVSGQAIVNGEHIGVRCVVVGVGLCFFESRPDLGWEDAFEKRQGPMQAHGPFSRSILRGSLALEDAAAKASLIFWPSEAARRVVLAINEIMQEPFREAFAPC